MFLDIINKMQKLTKQGVRDLGNSTKRKLVPPKEQCMHPRLRDCCQSKGKKACGHIDCPDCGLGFDVGFEFNGEWIW